MKFLVDNAVSPIIAAGLRNAGYDAFHVLQYGMAAAADVEIVRRAAAEERIIVTADTDFPMILATQQLLKPSVVLFRGTSTQTPQEQLTMLLDNLPAIEEALLQGSIVVFDRVHHRIRALPL
jgi:predicted nuclease of predicted toxin-antitoxin system